MKSSALILIAIFMLLPFNSEARRHKKFKGVIIVNQILKLRGTIKRNGENAAEYSGVKQGDLLETGDKSEAMIRIPGLAIFRMGANSKVKLSQFNDRNESRLEVLDGSFLSLYRRQGEHEVVLNHSIIKLHGTTFFALTPRDGKFDQVCLCDGKVQVTLKTAKSGRKPQSQEEREEKPVVTATATASASPVAAAAVSASATATATATQAPTPSTTPFPLPKEVVMESKWEHKMCQASSEGIEVKTDNKLLDLHTQAEIKDLESLYALP